MKILLNIPVWLTSILSSLKYFLLGFFLYVIVWNMDVAAITSFLQTPYNLAADAKMLLFFLEPTNLTLTILLLLVAISFVIANFWCRFLCPYGALLGLLAFFSPLRVNRNPDNCINCQKCDQQCPGEIKISHKITIRSPECIGCLECVAVCPQENCLEVQGPFGKKVATWLLPVLTVMFFFGFWAMALFNGHWQSKVRPETFRQAYQAAEQISHPAY